MAAIGRHLSPHLNSLRLAPRRSLRLRLLLGAALGLIGAMLVAWVVLGGILRDAAERAFDARLDAAALSLMAGLARDTDTGAVDLEARPADPRFEAPLSGWYWEVTEDGALLHRSRSLWDGRIGSAGGHPAGPAGERLRVDERRFSAPGGGESLLLRVAGPDEELQAAERRSGGTLLLLLLLLGAALLAASVLQVAIGLRPLTGLRRDLHAVRTGRLRRLPAASHLEVEPLVNELNTLLDHDEALVERSRRHAGNLAHALQTPLAALANLAAEPGRDPDGQVAAAVGRMRDQVRHQLRRARMAASAGVLGARVPVAEVLEDLAPVMRAAHRERGIRLVIDAPGDPVFAGDREDLEEVLGNLLDNAMKWARRQVTVTARGGTGPLVITISDDGPGLDAAGAALALERGRRLDEAVPGSGLGLAIAAETVEAYGGDLRLLGHEDDAPGLVVRLELPAAHRSPDP